MIEPPSMAKMDLPFAKLLYQLRDLIDQGQEDSAEADALRLRMLETNPKFITMDLAADKRLIDSAVRNWPKRRPGTAEAEG